jgi:hypothetical protein
MRVPGFMDARQHPGASEIVREAKPADDAGDTLERRRS